MKILDTLGTQIIPGTVPTGNLLWVDTVSGNDSLAVRGRMTVPFKTLTKAKESASAGDTIFVMPGTYNERNLLKNGVNWFFMPGAKVVYTGSDDGAIFDTSADGTNSSVAAVVTGYGQFERLGTGDDKRVVYSAASSSDLFIQGRKLYALDDAVKMADGSGSLRVEVTEDIHSENITAVTVSAASKCVIKAHELTTDTDYALQVTGGNVEMHAHRLSSGMNSAIDIYGGSGTVLVYAYEISSNTSSPTVKYAAPYNPVLAIYNARIVNSYNNASAGAISISSGGSNAIRLSNCTLLVTSTSAYAIFATADNTNVHFIGESVANTDGTHHKNAYVYEIGSALKYDSNIA